LAPSIGFAQNLTKLEGNWWVKEFKTNCFEKGSGPLQFYVRNDIFAVSEAEEDLGELGKMKAYRLNIQGGNHDLPFGAFNGTFTIKDSGGLSWTVSNSFRIEAGKLVVTSEQRSRANHARVRVYSFSNSKTTRGSMHMQINEAIQGITRELRPITVIRTMNAELEQNTTVEKI